MLYRYEDLQKEIDEKDNRIKALETENNARIEVEDSLQKEIKRLDALLQERSINA